MAAEESGGLRLAGPVRPEAPTGELRDTLRGIRLVAFDFDGVFTDDMVYVFQDGTEAVRCFRGDGLGLRKLERLGIASLIISTESNPVVSARAQKLRIRCVQGCDDKRAVLEELAAELHVTLAEVAFVGNDINDLACLRCVGLPIAVRNAHPDVVPHARYQTRTAGGQGAVREVCDLFEQALQDSRKNSTSLLPPGEGQDEGMKNQASEFDPLTPTLSRVGEGVNGTASRLRR